MVNFCRRKIARKLDSEQGPKRHPFPGKRTDTTLSKIYPTFGCHFGSSRAASHIDNSNAQVSRLRSLPGSFRFDCRTIQ